jgi:hypothetical protein
MVFVLGADAHCLFFFEVSGSLYKAKDMQRMLPTTEPLRRNFLDEAIVWIRADENERVK